MSHPFEADFFWVDTMRLGLRRSRQELSWEDAEASHRSPDAPSGVGSDLGLHQPGRWVWKGFWSIMDEGLFAASNFAVNVLLARWLAPEDFGAFTVAFAAFLLLGTFHTALLTEPMLVFGPRKYRNRLSEYLGVVLYGHVGFAIVGGMILLLGGVGVAMAGSTSLAATLLTLVIVGPLILFLWLMRSASYIRLEPHHAAIGGALYMGLMLMGVVALNHWQRLSAATALGVMGIASLIVGLWLVVRLRADRPPFAPTALVRDAGGTHWAYGRWAVASSAVTLASGDLYYYLTLPLWHGLGATASFKALANLVAPIFHATAALGVLLVPALSHARGDPRFARLVRIALGVVTCCTTFYWVLLSVFHRPVLTWLYGGQYLEHADLLILLGLWPVVAGVATVLAGAHRALERPDRVFWASGLSSLVVVVLSVALIVIWGILGAAIGLLLGTSVKAVVMGISYQRLGGVRVLHGDGGALRPPPPI